MNLENAFVQNWMAKSSPREKRIAYIAGFFIIYLFWNLIFEWPVHSTSANLSAQRQQLITDLDTQTKQLKDIESVISTSSFIQDQTFPKNLNQQSANEIKNASSSFMPLKDLTQVVNAIIDERYNVTLISLKTTPGEAWSSSKRGDLGLDLFGVYVHSMELHFKGTYFSTIDFLSHLEQLSWRIYWDNLDYKVLNYPEAEVVARFHVLSSQKD